MAAAESNNKKKFKSFHKHVIDLHFVNLLIVQPLGRYPEKCTIHTTPWEEEEEEEEEDEKQPKKQPKPELDKNKVRRKNLTL